jgi:hypothetical protein
LLLSSPLPAASHADASQTSLPLIENAGQWDPRARFLIRGNGLSLWIADDGLWLTRTEWSPQPARLPLPHTTGPNAELRAEHAPARSVNLHLTFPDSHPTLEPFGPLDTVVSFFTPQGRFENVPVWSGVRLASLYPDLDLEISGQDGYLTMKFVHSPETSPTVPLNIEGAEAIRLDHALPILSTALGDIVLPLESAASLTLQVTAGESRAALLLHPVASAFPADALLSPASRVYSTYLGGDADDTINTLAVNAAGEMYVAGETFSLVFPSGPGLNIPTHLVAAFISKLNSTGTALAYNINIVSAGLTENVIQDIVVDSAGNAYVAGFSDSADFPTTPGAYDTIPPAATNLYKAFVMKINPTGGVIYSTLLGTNAESELGNGIAVDPDGNAYITGYTQSTTFPTTPGAYDTSLGGERDIFVTKFNPTGTGLIYSTLLGGPGRETGERIVLDASNQVVISGYSEDGPSYPQTVPPLGPAGLWDIVVTKLNVGGTGLVFSTLVGGSSFDFNAQGLALDAAGNAYVSGGTYSADFPTSLGAYDTTLGGTVDAVLFKLNPTGNALAFSTYLGGSSAGVSEFIYDLALDSNNRPYVIGFTDSVDFPTTPGADSSLAGPVDFFVSVVNPTGTGLDFATLGGGSLEDYGIAIAIKTPMEFVAAGSTYSSDFPTTLDAYDRTPNGGGDGWIAAFKPLPLSLFLPIAIK